jgi:hypothetical protein
MVCKDGGQKPLAITRVWQKWRFSAPQTHLWLVKVWFSASKFVVKIATFAKPENVELNRIRGSCCNTKVFVNSEISSMSNLKTYYDEHNSTPRKIHSANGAEGLQQKHNSSLFRLPYSTV